jgi:hypothetical protein
MKTIYILRVLLPVAILFVNANCKKEPPYATATGVVVPPPPTVNTAPKVTGGADEYVFLPANTCYLTGSAFDKENNIQKVLWSKIAGPSSFVIENPNSFSTTVKDLEQGVYQFELTVTDVLGLYGKDTINVRVDRLSAGTHEFIFENRTWIFPWYNAIEIKNFFSIVAYALPFRIFIKREAAPVWIEVDPIAYTTTSGPYEYFIETRPDGAGMYSYGSLYIFYYGLDVSDTPDIKIVF